MNDRGPSAEVFISYSRTDGNEHVGKLIEALNSTGVRTWRDTRGIDPSKDFTAEIERAIKSATYVVVCVTPDIERDDSFVRREIQYALLCGKQVIVARFEEVLPPIHVINNSFLEFHKNWDEGFQRLLDILGPSTAETPPQVFSPRVDDPFTPYLERLYERVLSFIDQNAVIVDLPSVNQSKDATTANRVIEQVFVEGTSRSSHNPFVNFASAFDFYDGRVLLLGDPGSGKTTTVMSFLRDAIARRLADPEAPLPLLGLIPTWDKTEPSLADWLSGQNDLLPPMTVDNVVAAGNALLVLDGLDQLGSEWQVESKNTTFDPRQRFLEQIPPGNRVVVTCRLKEHQGMEDNSGLHPVILQGLTDDQIRAYLDEKPEILEAIEATPELHEWVRSPLLLTIFSSVWDEYGSQLRTMSKGKFGLDSRDTLFSAYIHYLFEREAARSPNGLEVGVEELTNVLGLAAFMQVSQQSANLIKSNDLMKIAGNRAEIIQTATDLHLLKPIGSHYQLTHSLLRDFFAYRCAVANLQDSTLYEHEAPSRAGDWLTLATSGLGAVFLGPVGLGLGAVGGAFISGFFANPSRKNPAQVIIELGGKKSVHHLIEALSSRAPIVREHVARALGESRSKRAVVPLKRALDDENPEVRKAAALALAEIGTPDALTSALAVESPSVRMHVVETLGKLGRKNAVEPLKRALEDDENSEVRKAAALALAEIGTPDALTSALAVESPSVRMDVVEALGELGGINAVGLLTRALKDDDPDVRDAAALAVRRLPWWLRMIVNTET